jgi:hypothetical protein
MPLMADRPKNILFLWSDEQRPDTLGTYGNRQVQTLHLDRLAAGGALFEQAYCAQPVCSPGPTNQGWGSPAAVRRCRRPRRAPPVTSSITR